jgi:hypothetical protein
MSSTWSSSVTAEKTQLSAKSSVRRGADEHTSCASYRRSHPKSLPCGRHGRHGFKLNPQALNTIPDFEQEDRPRQLQDPARNFWLTIVLMFVGESYNGRSPGSTSVLAVSGRSLRHPVLFPILAGYTVFAKQYNVGVELTKSRRLGTAPQDQSDRRHSPSRACAARPCSQLVVMSSMADVVLYRGRRPPGT